MKTSIKQPTKLAFWLHVGNRLLFWLLPLISLACNGASEDQVHANAALQASDKVASKTPTILLTGFEPFGEGRPPNPSWEGIKDLDGRQWRGYQLVCKQIPVVWEAPLQNFEAWVTQYHPVAIFSFGQGGPDSFALESRASNQRAGFSDNRDQQPPRPTIVEGGPGQFQASIDCTELDRYLSEKGYQTRVSTTAGQYLCEEALYSLEYLKLTKQLAMTVSFCHVPPLDTQIRGKPVTAAYVQNFVRDMLEAWFMVYQSKTPPGTSEQAADGPKPKPDDPRQQEVKEFVNRYFRTWSEQDMKGYNDCFMSDACIQFIDPRGRLHTYPRQEFIANQRDYHRNAPHRAKEVPESTHIRFEAKLARAVVYWKLTAGPRTETGYDHFTLMKYEGDWRIVSLVFYATEGPEPVPE
jgi:pyroglutamyl-peptidase